MTADLGLLVLRLVFGLLLAGHGAQKITPWFGGSGLRGGTEEFARDGFRGGVVTALAAGVSQIGGGLFLAAGLLTPLASMALVGVMTVAVTVKWHKGFWVQDDGIEFPFVMALVPAALAQTGPGRWSLDAALGLTWPTWFPAVAVVLGVAAALGTRALLRSAPDARG